MPTPPANRLSRAQSRELEDLCSEHKAQMSDTNYPWVYWAERFGEAMGHAINPGQVSDSCKLLGIVKSVAMGRVRDALNSKVQVELASLSARVALLEGAPKFSLTGR